MNAAAEAVQHESFPLWAVNPDESRPGMFIGYAQDKYGERFVMTSSSRLLIEEQLVKFQIPDLGEERFLDAWKRGVKIAGPGLFECGAESIDAATHKNQLCPRWEVVEEYLRSTSMSHWTRLFMIEMCSFYNSDWMQKHKSKMRMGRSSVGACAQGMDMERREVLADLLVNYRGW